MTPVRSVPTGTFNSIEITYVEYVRIKLATGTLFLLTGPGVSAAMGSGTVAATVGGAVAGTVMSVVVEEVVRVWKK